MGRRTFSDYVTAWLPSISRLAYGTQQNTQGRLNNHLLPFFGAMTLGSIQAADVRQWISYMVAKDLSASTIRSVYWLLGDILNAAEVDRHIARSPLAAMDTRKDLPQHVTHEDIVFLDAPEVSRLAAAITPRYRALIYTAAYGGLRFGELAALRTPRVDLSRGTLDVVQSLSDVSGRLEFKGTKTGARRTGKPAALPG